MVSDGVGNLYNKDAVIQFLLPGEEGEGIGNKADCEDVLAGRIRSIRDVVEVKFEDNNSQNDSGENSAKWICPVTQKELGPSVKSVYLVPCGHAFSEEAIREMKSDKCLQVSVFLLYIVAARTDGILVQRSLRVGQRHPYLASKG